MTESYHVPSALNYKVNSKETGIGHLQLTYDKSTKRLYLHFRLNSDYISAHNRASVLNELGFQYHNECHFFNRSGCFWRETARAPREAFNDDNILDRWSMYQHQAFERFSERLEAIIDMSIKLRELVPKGYADLKPIVYSFEVSSSLLQGSTRPGWTEKFIPDAQKLLKDSILRDIEKLQSDFVSFLGLLHESGELLEEAVLSFFRFLGLSADKTKKASPVDIKAFDETHKFAIEVTGINKAVAHKDGKVTQCFVYGGDKEPDEKIVLVANTFREIEPDQRTEASFSEQTIKLLNPLDVCLVTSYDLYRFWCEINDGSTTRAEVLDMLSNTTGVLVATTNTKATS